MQRFNLRETSEKTTEINTLSDVTSLIERISGRKVTIIAPTQNDEKDLGFDELIEDLPTGQMIAFQFKRPFYTPSIPNCTRYVLDTQQLGKLLDNFNPREAYYVLVPYPLNSDMVVNRRNLLRDTMTVDVYNVPNARKTSQKTRTVRFSRYNDKLGNIINEIRIADPRTFETISKTSNLESLSKKLIEGEVGVRIPLNEEKRRKHKEKEITIHPRKLFYVHVSSE